MTEYSPEFLEFWKKYPKRWIASSGKYVKIHKKKAWKVWKGLSAEDKACALKHAHKKSSTSQYVPDAFRWLRDGVYEDWEDEPFVPTPMAQRGADALKTVPKGKTTRQFSIEKSKQLKQIGE